MNGSFLSNDTPLPFDVNEFYRDSPPENVDQSSIQVIQSQDSSAPLSDFYSSLIPQKLESYNPEMSYGGNYQPSQQPPLPSGPPMRNYQNSSMPNYIVTPPLPPPNYIPQQIEYSSEIPLPPDNSRNEFNSWNWNSTSVDTPLSPPTIERKGHERVVEYIDDGMQSMEDNDTDHRQTMSNESGENLKSEKLERSF